MLTDSLATLPICARFDAEHTCDSDGALVQARTQRPGKVVRPPAHPPTPPSLPTSRPLAPMQRRRRRTSRPPAPLPRRRLVLKARWRRT